MQHKDLVDQLPDDCQVVADQDVGHAGLVTDVREQVQPVDLEQGAAAPAGARAAVALTAAGSLIRVPPELARTIAPRAR
jgi:hypothetical protein